jgi:hypothetical protein
MIIGVLFVMAVLAVTPIHSEVITIAVYVLPKESNKQRSGEIKRNQPMPADS